MADFTPEVPESEFLLEQAYALADEHRETGDPDLGLAAMNVFRGAHDQMWRDRFGLPLLEGETLTQMVERLAKEQEGGQSDG